MEPYPRLIFMIIIMFSVLSACSSEEQQSNLTRKVSTELEAQVDAYLNNHNFNGSILMARAGDVWLSKGYGMANFEDNIPITPDSQFQVGSVTKPFTALSIMQLQEEGLLHVTDTLDIYIPDYPRGDEITIHHLLSHTSGIQEYLQVNTLTNYFQQSNTPLELIDTFKLQPLLFSPGVRFNYSNSNYIILGYIIELASNQSYEDYINDHIFAPLHMNNSGYSHNEFDSKIHATGYAGTLTQPTTPPYTIDMSVPYAAGAIYSSVEDLFLWDQALYTNQLLTEQSVSTLYTPSIEIEPNRASYGYGWLIYHDPPNLVGHGGNIFGYSSTILRNLDNKNIIVILTNFDSYMEIENIAIELNSILDSYIERMNYSQ